MLVLSRKIEEGFRIPTALGDIHVSINDIRGHKVSVGIEAPREFIILRDELDDRLPPGPECLPCQNLKRPPASCPPSNITP
jgi:carbon storage regulator CsrA